MTARPDAPAGSDQRWVTWASFALWTVISFLAAVLSVTLVPVMVGGINVPVGILIVLVANIWLPRVFAQQIGVRGGAIVPGLVWLVVAIVASMPTADRDLLLPNNSHSALWSVIYLGVGSVAAAFGAFTARTSWHGTKPRPPVAGA